MASNATTPVQRGADPILETLVKNSRLRRNVTNRRFSIASAQAKLAGIITKESERVARVGLETTTRMTTTMKMLNDAMARPRAGVNFPNLLFQMTLTPMGVK